MHYLFRRPPDRRAALKHDPYALFYAPPSTQSSPSHWHRLLTTLEFEYNASRHGSKKLATFKVGLGYIQHTPVTRSLQHCKELSEEPVNYIDRRKAFVAPARENMATAVSRQKFYADRTRVDISFHVRNLILLRADNFSLTRRSTLPKKWQPRFIGPFCIRKVWSPVTYRIELPPAMRRTQDDYHVLKLKPFHNDRKRLLIIASNNDGTIEKDVRALLNKERYKRKVLYLVQFVCESREDAIWLPRTALSNLQRTTSIY